MEIRARKSCLGAKIGGGEGEKILSHKLFLQREYRVSHLGYDREMDFYKAVRDGNLTKLRSIMLPLKNGGLGKLSANPLRNLKYHLVVTIAMVTRFCIEGGLPSETAYTLSDIFIQRVDACAEEAQISALHREVVFDFAKRMRGVRRPLGLSRPVAKAIDYIYDHLQERMGLGQIAQAAGMSKNYLCALFKKETNTTVLRYAMRLRVEAASNMLSYADYRPIDIANYFMFSSHSHFIKTFKRQMGLTPEEYRRANYRRQWESMAPHG